MNESTASGNLAFMETVGKRIRFLRKLAKLTQEQFASVIWEETEVTRGAVGNWERDQGIKGHNLNAISRKFRVSMDWLANGTGPVPRANDLPHFSEDLLDAHGEGEPDDVPDFTYTTDDPATADDIDPDWDERSVAKLGGGLHFEGALPGGIAELAVSPGAGLGREIDGRAARIVTGGIASGHPVVAEWVIPPEFVRGALGARPTQVVLMPVFGHSMEPKLLSGDRVLVDISQDTYVGDAIYVIDDGDGVPRVKTVAKITSSKPPKFRIISEAYPDQPETLEARDFRLIGRVVGRFTKI